jgi:U4/U6.U5 tri-snRNP-associated protein 1
MYIQHYFIFFRDDERFGRRERYSGPTSDFREKDGYKPNVKLDYIDDDGRVLNAKEAFRLAQIIGYLFLR